MIEVTHLTKRYGSHAAVEEVSFSVKRGEIVGFLGPNGAGKTTTLRMITGYMLPTQGAIRVDGVDAVANSREARRRVGYMPEAAPLYSEMRVDEYLRYRASLKGVARHRVRARVDASMQMAKVADVSRRIIGQLSKGFRQRVALADALVADPPLLILDEPTAGLDPNQIRDVRDLIREFAGDKAVLVSTHILPEVEATCARVLIIHRGRIVGEGSPETLRNAQRGAQAVVFEARGALSAVRPVIEKVSGVRQVVDAIDVALHDGGQATRLRLEVDGSLDVTEAIFQAAVEARLVVRELRRDGISLEDVFAHLTLSDRSEPRPTARAEHAAVAPGDPDQPTSPDGRP